MQHNPNIMGHKFWDFCFIACQALALHVTQAAVQKSCPL